MKDWQKIIFDFFTNHGTEIVTALIILIAGSFVARWVGNLTAKWLGQHEMEPPIRTLLVRIVRLLLFALTLMVALEQLHVQLTPLIAGIGVAGVGVGLAMQGVLSNLVAGFTIIFTKPYRVGEYIEILGVYGQVTSIELFSTTLVHADQSRIVIPNRKTVGEVLHNYGNVRQLNLTVGVAYGTDLTLAVGIIREILEANTRVRKDPPPVVGIVALADSSINIAVQPWVAVPDYVEAQLELYQAIVERFHANQIAIPFPQREVRVLNAPAIVPSPS